MWFGKPDPEVPRTHTRPQELPGGWRATVWGKLLAAADLLRDGDVYTSSTGARLEQVPEVKRGDTVGGRFEGWDPLPAVVRPVG